jgi:hypothetical protein
VPSAPRIELPRPAIIAALGALILAVTFVVTKAGDPGAAVPGPSSSNPPASTSATTTPTTTTTAKPAKPKQPAIQPGQGLPAPMARALNAHKVVVLFFYEPAASDDQATRAAIRAVRRAGTGGRVALFQDTVSHISSYRRIVGSLGISQSPAMVVIDRNRRAELLQGFVDSGTIQQTVRDAL